MTTQWIDPRKMPPEIDAKLVIELVDGRAFIAYYLENSDEEMVYSDTVDADEFYPEQVFHYIPYPAKAQ